MMRLFLIIAVLGLWSEHAIASFSGVMDADNILDVYADGQYIGEAEWSGPEWSGETFNLPTSTRVIGLQGGDWGGLGGIIASFSDGLLTGASGWKCSATYTPGWAAPEFDDSAWAQATEYSRPDGAIPSGVSDSAKWIWTAGYEFVDKVVFCRHVTDSVTGTWTADNSLDVFVDGVHFAHTEGSGSTTTGQIPKTAQVIGLRGLDWGGIGGIIASFSDGMVTDASWKCSATYSDGWSTAGFDDSSWAQATAYVRPDGARPPGVDEDAQWIWTANYYFEDKVVYCRKARGAQSN